MKSVFDILNEGKSTTIEIKVFLRIVYSFQVRRHTHIAVFNNELIILILDSIHVCIGILAVNYDCVQNNDMVLFYRL